MPTAIPWSGASMRLRRTARGMSAADVCAALASRGLSVSDQSLYDYERDRRAPPKSIRAALARILRCRMGDLEREPVL